MDAAVPVHKDAVAPGASHVTCSLASPEFPELNRLLDHHALLEERPKHRLERMSLRVGLAGAFVGILLANLLSGTSSNVAALAGLAVEIIGLGSWTCLQLKDLWRSLVHARAQHAEELERSYITHRQIVEQLRTFPRIKREQRHRYIRDRRAVMQERLGLFTGSMEKLGVLPVLLALYLQLKDWRWGHWNVLAEITLTQGLLAMLLLSAYALSWLLIRLRARVQMYELLLEESVRQDGEPPLACPR